LDVMSPAQALETAREILHVMPLVMRTVVAGLRSAGELPAPAHFPLLVILKEQSRTLSELAELRGVSLPTMSNSISALVQRGWVRRVGAAATSPGTVAAREGSKGSRHRSGTAPLNRLPDRRVVFVEVTAAGLAALDRVERAAERHLADVLGPLDLASRRRLTAGFSVLKRLFDAPPAGLNRRRREPSSRVTRT
jgi:DNA-binding MarR family transcriptional regulator